MATRNEIRPFVPVHPGAILKAELKERQIRQKDFAEQIGMRPTHLNALLQGGRNISPQLAVRLEHALGIPAKNWLNLQENYNLDRIRTVELVDGYEPQEPTMTYALAEPNGYENPVKVYKSGYEQGQADLLEQIISHLHHQGYSREEALHFIGK